MNFNLQLDREGTKNCIHCAKAFTFADIIWDHKDIEYNSDTLWIDSICSKECALLIKKKHNDEERYLNIDATLNRNGVPRAYLHCTFENYRAETPHQRRALEHLKNLSLPLKRSLFLNGPCGTGKTHLAVATMRRLTLQAKGTYPLYISAPKLISEIRSGTLGEIEFNAEEIINKYTAERFLIIDDIGVEKTSDFVTQCWYRIIDTRTSNSLPTLYTSNLSKDDLATQMGVRVASRLSACLIIPIDGNDKREIINSKVPA